jgi:hypothetical protein
MDKLDGFLNKMKRKVDNKTCKNEQRLTHSLTGNTTGKNNIDTITEILLTTSVPPKTDGNVAQEDTSLEKFIKKEKIKRIYEDDDFIIDLFTEEKMLRVSVFDGGHFKDEVLIRKEDYCGI